MNSIPNNLKQYIGFSESELLLLSIDQIDILIKNAEELNYKNTPFTLHAQITSSNLELDNNDLQTILTKVPKDKQDELVTKIKEKIQYVNLIVESDKSTFTFHMQTSNINYLIDPKFQNNLEIIVTRI